MKHLIGAAAIVLASAGMSAAASYTYDFKAAAEPTGALGESIFSTFSTSSVFTGPNLDITATKGGSAAFVYFDANNAGMGVCGEPTDPSLVGDYPTNSGGNRCNPSSDDGLTTTDEDLFFTATDKALKIKSIFINSNHDTISGPVTDTAWNIGGTVYDSSDFTSASISGTGDIRIDVNFFLDVGETLTLEGVRGPNSYISAITVSPVPLPAGALLLLTGAGAFAFMRRRRGA